MKAKSSISELLSSYYHFSKSAGEPRATAIVGAPNAGKSTLLNSLIGSERSIVSNIAATRDVVEARIKLPSGRWIRILDTAGLRGLDHRFSEENNPHAILEKRGIDLGLESADLAAFINLGEKVR